VFDLIAEVTQMRNIPGDSGMPEFEFYGGCTIILGPRGEVRYVIRKKVNADTDVAQQRVFFQSQIAQEFSLRRCLA